MASPLRLWEGEVLAEWVDANRHMNDGCYAVAFGEASWRVQDHLGRHGRAVPGTDRRHPLLRGSPSHVDAELTAGQRLHVESLVLGVDAKRLRVFHRLFASDAGYLAATMDVMMLHVVQARTARAPAPFPDDVARRLRAVAAEHAALGRPEEAGRAVRERRGARREAMKSRPREAFRSNVWACRAAAIVSTAQAPGIPAPLRRRSPPCVT